jgi:hypothetical protein
MLSYDEFTPRYRRLIKAYGKTESGEQCAAYYDALKTFPEGILEKAIAKVIADERFFPAASVLRAAAHGILAGATYEAPQCPRCDGNGFIEAEPRVVFQVTYPTVKLCPECGYQPVAVGE